MSIYTNEDSYKKVLLPAAYKPHDKFFSKAFYNVKLHAALKTITLKHPSLLNQYKEVCTWNTYPDKHNSFIEKDI